MHAWVIWEQSWLVYLCITAFSLWKSLIHVLHSRTIDVQNMWMRVECNTTEVPRNMSTLQNVWYIGRLLPNFVEDFAVVNSSQSVSCRWAWIKSHSKQLYLGKSVQSRIFIILHSAWLLQWGNLTDFYSRQSAYMARESGRDNRCTDLYKDIWYKYYSRLQQQSRVGECGRS